MSALSVPLRPPVLVGRDAELEVLEAHVSSAVAAWAGLLVISGPAGIGKSRVLEAAIERAGGKLRTVDATQWLTLDPNAVPAVCRATFAQRAHEELERGGATPLFVFDGVEARDARLDDVRAVFARLDAFQRGIAVVAVRSEDVPAIAGAHILHLPPLPPHDMRLLQRIAVPPSVALPKSAIARAVQLAAGNPGNLCALLRAAADAFTIGADPDVALPAHVVAEKAAIMRALSPSARRFLQAAAISGKGFDIRVVAGIASLPVDDAIDEAQALVDAGILRNVGGSGDVAFRSPLLQEAIACGLVALLARRLHRRAALHLTRIDAAQHLEAVAEHWMRAGEGKRAFALCVKAARGARKRGEHERAAAWFTRALIVATPETRAALESERALALRDAGAGAAAVDAFDEQLRQDESHDPVVVATLLHRALWQCWGECDYARAQAFAAQIDELPLAADHPLRARALIARANLVLADNPAAAVAFLADVAPATVAADAAIATMFHTSRGKARWLVADPDGARADFARAIERGEEADEPRYGAIARNEFAVFLTSAGRIDEALATVESAHERALAINAEDLVANSALTWAEALLLRGELTLARQKMRVAFARSIDVAILRTYASIGIVIGLLAQDDALVEACVDDTIVATALRSNVPGSIAAAAGSVAQLHLARNDVRGALQALRSALSAIRVLDGTYWFAIPVAQVGASADIGAARALLAAAAWPGNTAVAAFLALFDAIVARRAKRWREAIRRADVAIRAFRTLAMPYFEAQALEAAGRYGEAIDEYERIGARRDAAHLRLRRAGAQAAPRDTGLTERERHVADLAAQGLRSKAIAQALGISERTVQHHLQAVYAKLGIRSRFQLAAAVAGETH